MHTGSCSVSCLVETICLILRGMFFGKKEHVAKTVLLTAPCQNYSHFAPHRQALFSSTKISGLSQVYSRKEISSQNEIDAVVRNGQNIKLKYSNICRRPFDVSHPKRDMPSFVTMIHTNKVKYARKQIERLRGLQRPGNRN